MNARNIGNKNSNSSPYVVAKYQPGQCDLVLRLVIERSRRESLPGWDKLLSLTTILPVVGVGGMEVLEKKVERVEVQW